MNMKVSTVLNIGLLILALVFATLGFAKAGDSYVAPLVIAVYMGISAVIFGVLAVRGMRRKEMWQRLLGVGAVVAALYMLAFAIWFYISLGSMQTPTF